MIAIVQTYSGKIRCIDSPMTNGVYQLKYSYDEPFFVLGVFGAELNKENYVIFWGDFESINYQNAFILDKRVPIPPQNYYHSPTDKLTFSAFGSSLQNPLSEINAVLESIVRQNENIIENQDNFELLYRQVNNLGNKD